jgi:uncharacterized protein (DUF2132 family)
VTVSAFLVALAKRVESAPMCDAALAKQCRDFATISLNLEHRETLVNAVAAAKRATAKPAKPAARKTTRRSYAD